MNQRNIKKVIMTMQGRKRLENNGELTTQYTAEGERVVESFLEPKDGSEGSQWRTSYYLENVTGIDYRTINKIKDNTGVREEKLRKFFVKCRLTPRRGSLEKNEGDYGFLPSATEGVPLESGKRGNLPVLQPLIGREKELNNILKTLGTESSRLTILTGLGGMGKTHLAIALGHKVKSKFQDRVWMIDLSKTTEAEKIEHLIRTELQLKDYEGLEKALGVEPMLLILDNCEHLLKAGQQLIKRLLSSHSCSSLHILATSREAFWIVAGQRPYPVEGLEENAAVELFLQRSQERGVSIEDKDKPAVLEICGTLDYFPLAIELAAARARMKPQNIKMGLQKRFEFLTKTDNGDAPQRHSSLEAALDWSYELLTETEQDLFRRLSIFKGGWTTDAARAICAEEEDAPEIPDLLWELENKSLITFERETESRYRMLETLREYAATKMTQQENDRILERHKQYFLKWIQESSRHLDDRDGVNWMRLIDKEYPNLIAALTLNLKERAIQNSLVFCGALQGYWGRRGSFSEGLEWCRQALAVTNSLEYAQEQAWVLNAAGGLAYSQGDLTSARQFYIESLSIRESLLDNESISDSYNNIGLIEYEQGAYDAALTNFQSCWQTRLELGKSRNPTSIAYILINIGMAYCAQGDYVAAQQHYDKSYSLLQALENLEGVAYVDANRGWMALVQKKYQLAMMFFERSRQFFTEARDQRSLAEVENGLGLVAVTQGDYLIAWNYLENSLLIRRDTEDQKGIIESVESFATLAAVQRQPERADQLWYVAAILRQGSNIPLPPHKQNEYKTVIGKAKIRTAGTEKETMTLTQAVKYALTKPNLLGVTQ